MQQNTDEKRKGHFAWGKSTYFKQFVAPAEFEEQSIIGWLMYLRTLCLECYKKEPQRGMNEEDCLYLFALIKMCFRLSVYFLVQVVTPCRSSGGNSSSFDNSNVCYFSFVSFWFCCIFHRSCSFPSLFFERSLCRFSALCLPVCLQRPVTQISALALFLSSPLFQEISM